MDFATMVPAFVIIIFMVIYVNIKNVLIIAVKMGYVIIKLVNVFAMMGIQIKTAL